MRSVDDLVRWIDGCGGAAHTRSVAAAGFTVHVVRTAVALGVIERVRRSWLVLPACDPARRAAATAGGRLTCLSAASALGLWTPLHDEVHVAVARTASRVRAPRVRLHWGGGPAPTSALQTDEPLINVLFHVARCVPLADAAAVWESALRGGHTDRRVLERVQWGSERARRLASVASLLSDSGIETHFTHLMHSIGVTVVQQVWVDGHPLDCLIGERLVVQLDGFAHHQASDRRRDLRADARLALRGFTVLRFDYHQILFDPAYVTETITDAMAQGLHRQTAVSRRSALFRR
ncbi:DUF559 domain-containing protein [Microbacterium schleiferi]|uniref:DUF559 domain-containing protein n=1 Tax=Microbacterium schleiferi TaxID=69362 RepID=A0A7S8MYR0_9MICO|nr:DUF559 domain-containing protein [Microbacterium schleiferi]QPE05378.1 DUF559 domain-containing protein [Microbacterium schleiferi]